MTTIDGLPHPPLPAGDLSHYRKGCRCGPCHATNAKAARDQRRRHAEGRPSPHERIPNTEARETILQMRRQGMIWPGLEALIGHDRRVLQNIVRHPGGRVTRLMDAHIREAARRIEVNPDLLDHRRKLFPVRDRCRWMVGSLIARGWPTDWIGRQVGWNERLSISTLSYDLVTVDFWARVEGVFKSHHTDWGPSRLTAVRAWRRGIFISDCYDWDTDTPDYRPIPGTFHPDLVTEAATYKKTLKGRGTRKLGEMHTTWGQWEKEPCAAAALHTWQQTRGEDFETDDQICRYRRHNHDQLPTIWSTQP